MYSTVEQIFLYLDDNTLGEIESCSDTLKLFLAGGKFWEKRLKEKASDDTLVLFYCISIIFYYFID